MRAHRILEVGAVYDRWTVLGEGTPKIASNGKTIYTSKCRCTCGEIKDVPNSLLGRSRGSKSCGCLRRVGHKRASAKHPSCLINGYRVVYHPEHHTNSRFSKMPGYIYEHRFVMEKFLGRPLRRDEHVHHIDGNKSNNDISNLVLLAQSEHARHHIRELAEKQGKHHIEERICRECGRPTARYGTLCGECARKKSIKINLPPRHDFQIMIDNWPLEKVANVVGVSSNAVKKWIRKLGLHYVPFYNRKHGDTKKCPLE